MSCHSNYCLSPNVNRTYTSSYASSVSSSSSSNSTTPEPESIKAPLVKKAPKKSYQCPSCAKSFTRPSALQTHSYTHTAEKPFGCHSPGCNRQFSVVSNLRRHFKVHQKTSTSNKISSEERLRFVRELLKNTDALLSKNRQEEHPDQPPAQQESFSLESRSNSRLPSRRQQHYLLLPAIAPHPSMSARHTDHHQLPSNIIRDYSSLSPPFLGEEATYSPFYSYYS